MTELRQLESKYKRSFFMFLLLCSVSAVDAKVDDNSSQNNLCCDNQLEIKRVNKSKANPELENTNRVKPQLESANNGSSDKLGKNIYPYIKAGVSQNFGRDNDTGLEADVFIPIFWADTKIFFSNIKINNYFDGAYDGGLYFGYRFLLPEDQQLYGVYASFDVKKTYAGNYFNQVTFGVEYWLKQWFFGASIYNPMGNKLKNNGDIYEKAVPGIGAEIGYEFSKKSALYVEGYRLNTTTAGNVLGVKVKFKQNLFSKDTKPGILDKIDLEVGVQKDKLLGNRAFLELTFKIGAVSSNLEPTGVAAHMTDTIFRSKSRFVTENVPTVDNYKVMKCYYSKSGKLGFASDSSCPSSPHSAGGGIPGSRYSHRSGIDTQGSIFDTYVKISKVPDPKFKH